jgi:hypothetical protein
MESMLQTGIAWARRHPGRLLVALLVLGLVPRLILLPTAGFALDLVQLYEWGRCFVRHDWLGMYDCPSGITHPPLSVSLFGATFGALHALGGDTSTFEDNAAVIIALKLPSLICEYVLITLVFWLVWQRAGVLWAGVAAAALLFDPGFAVVTAWWGQTDAIYSVFVLLGVALLRRDRPRLAWLALGLALLAKIQTIMFLPVLAVLTLRRFGWRTAIRSAAGFGLVFVAGVIPFLLVGGDETLRPFTKTVDLFPYITNGAYNLWFWLTGASQAVQLDSRELAAGVSYKQAGLALLVLGETLLCARAWLLPDRDDDFLLLAAANLVFFMLPTQMQVRYLYPGLVFLALAMVRRPVLVALQVGLAITFTYNVFDVVWLGHGILYHPARLLFWEPVHTALAVTLAFAILVGITFYPLRRACAS